MARQRERDILVTVAALAATALLVVLFNGSQQTPQEIDSGSRFRRGVLDAADGPADQDSFIDKETGYETCDVGYEYTENCTSEPCCVFESRGGDGATDDAEGRAGKKRRKKNKKPKVTDPEEIYTMFADRNSGTASNAMRDYNRAVKNSPEVMLAGRDPTVTMDLGAVAAAKNTFLDSLDNDSGVNCRSGSAQVSFKTKQVIIAFPTSLDMMSVDKAGTYSKYLGFVNTMYNAIKGQSRTKVYSAPYQMQAIRVKEMKREISEADAAFVDSQNIQNPSWGKLMAKTYNSFIKKYVGNGPNGLKTQSTTSAKSCFLIFIIQELPKDYGNMMRRDKSYEAFYDYTQSCTIIPVFMQPNGMTPDLYNSLVPLLVPGTAEGQVYDDDMRGFYTVSGGKSGPTTGQFNSLAEDIMSYMCMAETHVFCNRLYPAWVDTAEEKGLTDPTDAPTAAATEGTTTEGTTTEAPEPTERTTTEEIFYESTAAVAVDDSCCGCQPYLTVKFNQNDKICCKDQDGEFSIIANYEVCPFPQQ